MSLILICCQLNKKVAVLNSHCAHPMNRNYEIHKRDVGSYLEAWRYFLEGVKNRFEILIDHKNMEYFMKNQKLNHRLL